MAPSRCFRQKDMCALPKTPNRLCPPTTSHRSSPRQISPPVEMKLQSIILKSIEGKGCELIGVERMLRMYLNAGRFNSAAEGFEDADHGVPAFRLRNTPVSRSTGQAL